eukprot:2491227-Pyramimonas_sp.AAC.1
MDCGCPEDRLRLIIVGELTLAVNGPRFEMPLFKMPSAKVSVRSTYNESALQDSRGKLLEDAIVSEGLNAGETQRLNEAYELIRKGGVDPKKSPFVIDIGGSK